MTKCHSTCLRALICLVLLLICQVVPAQGVKSKETTPPDPNQAIQDLLAEVHELRMTLERAATSANRAQILMERIRIAQPRVDNLVAKVAITRAMIAAQASKQATINEEIGVCESKLASDQMFPGRADYEKECKEYPADLEEAKQTEQELRDQETQLARQLQIEQSKLDELNDRLDKLDQELKDAQPVNKTPTRKNP